MADDSILDKTRRAVLKSAVAALGVGGAGAASGHPGLFGREKGGAAPEGDYRVENDPEESAFRNAAAVGYHSMGGKGPSSDAGGPEEVYDGTVSELEVVGDIAAITVREATEDDAGRRLAVLDVSEFNAADTREGLEAAELTVLGFLRNKNGEMNGATDLRLSDDGNYAFLGTQSLVPGGRAGTRDGRDPRSGVETTGGVVAVDITDPENPETAGSLTEPFSTGIHNVFHHRIDGRDYVFACKDAGLVSPDSGLYILEFDRDTGVLEVVNRWSADGNTARGEVGPEHGLSYVHDVHVVDDPRTGRPTVYLADWDRGLRVLDATDPAELEHVGQFDMHQSHESTPVPGLVEDADGNMRRVAVTSHEEPDHTLDQRQNATDQALYKVPHPEKTNPNSTGTVFLVDCDGIYPEDAEADHLADSDVRDDGDEPVQLGELDNWTWRNVDTDEGVDYEDIAFPEFSYALSPHNQSIQKHHLQQPGLPPGVSYRNEERWVLHQSSYNLGVRYIVIEPGSDRGLTEIDGGTAGDEGRRRFRPTENPNVEGRDGDEEFGWINNTTDWNLRDVGHARPSNDTVVENDQLSPDFWCSIEHNGLTLSGDRNSGVRVTHHDAIPLRDPIPAVELERTGTDPVVTGDAYQVSIEVASVDDDREVLVRDRIPAGYELVEGDDATTYPNGDGTIVEFDGPVTAGDTLEYSVEPAGEPGTDTFGPVEVSTVDGPQHSESWDAVGGTAERTVTLGFGG